MKGYKYCYSYLYFNILWKNEEWIWDSDFDVKGTTISMRDFLFIGEYFFQDFEKKNSEVKSFHIIFETTVCKGKSIIKKYNEDIIKKYVDKLEQQVVFNEVEEVYECCDDDFNANDFLEFLGFENNKDYKIVIQPKLIYGIQFYHDKTKENEIVFPLIKKSFCRLFEIWKCLTKSQIEKGLAIKGRGNNILNGLLGSYNNKALKIEEETGKWVVNNLNRLKSSDTYNFFTNESIKVAKERAVELKKQEKIAKEKA